MMLSASLLGNSKETLTASEHAPKRSYANVVTFFYFLRFLFDVGRSVFRIKSIVCDWQLFDFAYCRFPRQGHMSLLSFKFYAVFHVYG